MNKDEIVKVLNEKVKQMDDSFSVTNECGDLCLKTENGEDIASFNEFQSDRFHTGETLEEDELSSFLQDEYNHFLDCVLVARYFYDEGKLLLVRLDNE